MPNNPIGRLMDTDYYANNDYWYDDTSDGPGPRQVRIGGKPMAIKDRAWVLVTPPKYAPDAEMITTLYDTAIDTWDKQRTAGSCARRACPSPARYLSDPIAPGRHHMAQSHGLPTSWRQHQQRLRQCVQ